MFQLDGFELFTGRHPVHFWILFSFFSRKLIFTTKHFWVIALITTSHTYPNFKWYFMLRSVLLTSNYVGQKWIILQPVSPTRPSSKQSLSPTSLHLQSLSVPILPLPNPSDPCQKLLKEVKCKFLLSPARIISLTRSYLMAMVHQNAVFET